jgi:SlyX protein
MTPSAATDADDLAARVEKLEIRAAYQDQAVDDLNKTITAQWAQIEALTLQIKRLLDRLSQIEQGGGAADAADEPPPPHY